MSRIHSVVDVITNSSTVIFVQAGDQTIKSAKDIAQKVLDLAGSDKKAEDLFDFKIEYDEVYCYLCDEKGYDEKCPVCNGKEEFLPTQEQVEEHYEEYNNCMGVGSQLVVTSKETGEIVDFKLNQETDAYRDG